MIGQPDNLPTYSKRKRMSYWPWQWYIQRTIYRSPVSVVLHVGEFLDDERNTPVLADVLCCDPPDQLRQVLLMHEFIIKKVFIQWCYRQTCHVRFNHPIDIKRLYIQCQWDKTLHKSLLETLCFEHILRK
jgi:hypothetical protein